MNNNNKIVHILTISLSKRVLTETRFKLKSNKYTKPSWYK